VIALIELNLVTLAIIKFLAQQSLMEMSIGAINVKAGKQKIVLILEKMANLAIVSNAKINIAEQICKK
jgi:hypothetical protein